MWLGSHVPTWIQSWLRNSLRVSVDFVAYVMLRGSQNHVPGGIDSGPCYLGSPDELKTGNWRVSILQGCARLTKKLPTRLIIQIQKASTQLWLKHSWLAWKWNENIFITPRVQTSLPLVSARWRKRPFLKPYSGEWCLWDEGGRVYCEVFFLRKIIHKFHTFPKDIPWHSDALLTWASGWASKNYFIISRPSHLTSSGKRLNCSWGLGVVYKPLEWLKIGNTSKGLWEEVPPRDFAYDAQSFTSPNFNTNQLACSWLKDKLFLKCPDWVGGCDMLAIAWKWT